MNYPLSEAEKEVAHRWSTGEAQSKTSSYRGVYKKGGMFYAGLWLNKRQVFLGSFTSQEEAARKVDEKLGELGQTSLLNFPRDAPVTPNFVEIRCL